jgi:hypothetical protein
MKLQNLSFFEKHVEKLAFLVGLVVLLAVGGYYLLGSPFGAELAGQPRTSPASVEEPIQQKASELRSKVQADSVFPPEDAWALPDYPDHFFPKQAAPPVKVAKLPARFGEAGLDQTVLPEPPTEPYNVPTPPLPTVRGAYGRYAQIGADAAKQIPDALLEQLSGEGPPYDMHFASVSADFNLQGWLDALASGPEAQQVPKHWALPLVTGVYLQRQTYDPVNDQWSETRRIDPLPTQPAYLPETDREWSPRQARNARRRIAKLQPWIRRPFLARLSNQPWQPPTTVTGEPPELESVWYRPAPAGFDTRRQVQVRDRRQRVSELLNQVERLISRAPVDQAPIDEIERRWDQTWQRYLRAADAPRFDGPPRIPQIPTKDEDQGGQRNGNRDGESPRDPREPPGGFGPPERRRDVPPPPGRFGDDAERVPMAEAGGQSRGRGQDFAGWQLDNLDNRASVRVWAHDLSVKPGKVYRYRVIVAMFNPLFQKRAVPAQQQQTNYHKISIAPAPSPTQADGWSKPVQVEPDHFFFMVNGAPSRRQATIEVWRRTHGQWFSRQFRVSAGDGIGQRVRETVQRPVTPEQAAGREDVEPGDLVEREITVDYRTGATLVDVTESAGRGLTASVTRMLYRPADQNRLLKRTLDADRDHWRRVTLQNEVADLPGRLEELSALSKQKQAEIEQRQREAEEDEVRF